MYDLWVSTSVTWGGTYGLSQTPRGAHASITVRSALKKDLNDYGQLNVFETWLNACLPQRGTVTIPGLEPLTGSGTGG